MLTGLTAVAWIALGLGVVCAMVIVGDIAFVSPQKMWIMNVVWPMTALYSGPIGLLAYYRAGRLSSKTNVERAQQQAHATPAKRNPFGNRSP